MHVERERRRRAALPQRLISNRVVEKARTTAAPFLPDRQRENAFLAQPLIILERMACIAVVRCRALGKIRRQFQAFLLQPALLGGEGEIHGKAAISIVAR